MRRLGLRALVRDVLAGYERVDLLTYGSAIAFQVLFALIPVLLFGLGLLGWLGLDDGYTKHVVPELKRSTSPDVFQVVDRTVRRVLSSKQLFWVSAGAVMAVWEMSGAMRAIMAVFDRIYGCRRERSFKERYLVSTLLAISSGTLLLAAVVIIQFGTLVGIPRPVAWVVAVVPLAGGLWLLMRYAPADGHPWSLISAGTVMVLIAWIATSVAFGFYVTQIAEYGSIFGNLATIIIAFEYFYLAACAFLTGALVDSILRERGGPQD